MNCLVDVKAQGLKNCLVTMSVRSVMRLSIIHFVWMKWFLKIACGTVGSAGIVVTMVNGIVNIVINAPMDLRYHAKIVINNHPICLE